VLLLDEPFTGLTYLERLQLATSLAKLGGTYVITTSNEETLALVPAAKVFKLAGGTLEELREVPGLGALEAAQLCKALGIGVNHGVES
jgi:energy-coupling factor transport system ATP-binding protein